MRQKLFILFLLLFQFQMLSAQFPSGMGTGMGGRKMNVGRFYGKVVDAKTNKGVEFAAVQLMQGKTDTVAGTKEKMITGQLTSGNGDFSLDSLMPMGEYTLRISAMGYSGYEQRAKFDIQKGNINSGNWQQALSMIDKDLGNIKLQPAGIDLKQVTIDGTTPILELRADKKVYNVEKNPINTGGTAEDVLKNVPSVNVDIDGNVSMRNAAPQIFVDGRPTTMTLDQIPADAIQEIEIITNPSAKYDASGGMAGILNIVLKKNRRIGYNGTVRTGVDSRGRINAGADLNIREGKVNWFGSGNLNQRKSKGTTETDRINFGMPPTTQYNQIGKSTTNGYFGFLRSGFDFFLDNRNTLTISGNYTRGSFNPVEDIVTTTDTLFSNYTTTGISKRNSDNERNFRNGGGSLSFKHLFPKDGEEFTADVNFNTIKSKVEGEYTTQNYNSLDEPFGDIGLQQQKINGQNYFYTAQADYVTPLQHKMKIETGLRGSYREYESKNQNYFFDDNTQSYILATAQTSDYIFTDQVYAVYLTFSQQLAKFNYSAGLRAESSFYIGDLKTTGQSFKNDYPVSLFPSAFISYKLNEKNSVQLNYTRRINRPNFFQLIPYTDYSDSLNLSRGNPDLKPEFTNSMELSYQKTFSRKNTLLASVYFKNTNNLITRFLAYEYDTVLQQQALISTFQNANSSYAYGIELTLQNNIIKDKVDITFNINAYQSRIDGSNIETNLESDRFSYFSKLSFNIKLPKNFSVQLSGDYQSKTSLQQNTGGGSMRGMGGGGFGGGPQSTAQGYVRESYSAEAGIKFEFLKEKAASLTFNVQDIFKTRKNDTHYESGFYEQNTLRKRDAQVMRLTFSYRFGKFDTSIFKRKNLKINTDGLQDMM